MQLSVALLVILSCCIYLCTLIKGQDDFMTCSATVTVREKYELSPVEKQLLDQFAPKATSKEPIYRAEIRAPIHAACQIKHFPHIKEFSDAKLQQSIPNLAIKAFTQPPHVVFFDEYGGVVKVLPVSPSWSHYKLRDIILDEWKIGPEEEAAEEDVDQSPFF